MRGSSTGKSLNLSVIREVGGVHNHLQPKGFVSLSESIRSFLYIKTLMAALLEATRHQQGKIHQYLN